MILALNYSKYIVCNTIKRYNRSLWMHYPLVSIRSLFTNKPTPTKQERLYTLMNHYRDKPAGMWHEMYHAQIFLKDLFDAGCDSDEGREFARNWCKIRAHICGGSGLSQIEKDAIVAECHCWCPSISIKEFDKLCDIAADLTEDEVQTLCNGINKSYPIECRKALLLNSLCGASLDGLSFVKKSGFKFGVDKKEIEVFTEIAKKFGVDDNSAHDIFQLYTLESKLKLKYDEFYNQTKI
eukprot:294312_1